MRCATEPASYSIHTAAENSEQPPYAAGVNTGEHSLQRVEPATQIGCDALRIRDTLGDAVDLRS